MKIGFLGLGKMGAAIAANILGAGHDLTVWNRSPEKAEMLRRAGAVVAATPRQVGAASEIVFSMLADDVAVDSVLAGDDGLIAGLAKGGLHASMSTIAVATADRIAALHQKNGQRFISTPVFGRPDAAAAAKLFVVAAGATEDIALAAPILAATSQRRFDVGDTPSAANLVKLCGNFAILAAIETMGEAMALAEKGGVPPAQLLEVLTGSLFDAPIYRNYGAIIVKGGYRPAGFAAPLGLKDMRLVSEAAEANRVAMPVLSVLRDHLLETIAKEGDAVDWSGIALTIAKNAGLKTASEPAE